MLTSHVVSRTQAAGSFACTSMTMVASVVLFAVLSGTLKVLLVEVQRTADEKD